MQETHFMRDHVFFNNISIMGEMKEEWKNSTVIPIYKKGYKKNVENSSGINLLNTCYKVYSKILNDKLKAQRGKFLLECQNGF